MPHPRDFDNSLWHGYIQGGIVYDSFGQAIESFGGSNVVDAVVKSLRRKLGPLGSALETVIGHGYRFTGFSQRPVRTAH